MSENYNKCQICSNNAKLPVATRCGHIFCWKCIKNRGNSDGILNCPACNKEIKINQVVKLFTGDNQTNNGEVDDRPQPARNQARNPGFFNRIRNNFRMNVTDEITPPTQKELQTNVISLIVLVLAICFIFYILK